MIRPATPADLGPISEYLARTLAGGAPTRYRRFLDYGWLPVKPDLGVLVEDAGRVHGFIGAIYAQRGDARFCNLTSIAVDPSHRRHTLQMFARVLAAKDVTYTCFSATDQIGEILTFFKFQHRPSDKVVVCPISGLGRLWSARRATVVVDPTALDAALEPAERAIARDHRAYRCGQLLIEAGSRRCFVVTIKRGRGARVFADVLHASDPELLVEHLPRVHGPLFRAHRTLLTGIDHAWLSRRPRVSFTFRKLRPIYMRSPSVKLHQLDALYSELVPMYG